MFRQLTRTVITAAILPFLFATSSALGANHSRSERTVAARLHAHHHRARATRGRRSATGIRLVSAVGTPTVLLGEEALQGYADGLTAGQAEAFPFVALSPGAIGAAHVYIDSHNTAKHLIVGVYSALAGRPASLLATGSLSSLQAGAWNTVPVASATLASGTSYWVAILGTGGTLRYRDRLAGRCQAVTSSQTNLSALASTWRTERPWWTCPISAYVTAANPLVPVEPAPPLEEPKPPVEPPPAAPANTALPAVTGTATEGQKLTASAGTWTGSPTSYAYQWQDCNSSGTSCVGVGGATASSYTLGSGDVGHTVRVAVTASNAAAAASATSASVGPVSASVGPVSASPPTASFTYSPTPSITGEAVTLDGSTSVCPDGPCTYVWSDDGGPTRPTPPQWPLGSGQTLHFAFSGAGTKYVRLVVTDAAGQEATVEHNVAIETAPVPPPANTTPPAISGIAKEGETITASNGTWTGSPISYTYQWQDCNTLGEGCVPIEGATASTYVLAGSDVAQTVTVVVTATNAGGSTQATSAPTSSVLPAAPTNISPPMIAGSVIEGGTLTAEPGIWTGSPTSFTYQWEDCGPLGEACAPISGATGSSYALGLVDPLHTLRVAVTATNAGGSTTATSAATGTPLPPAPTNTAAPSITGSAVEGETLKAATGSWSGSPTSYAYQWQDCNVSGEACVAISAATSATYHLLAADVGHRLRAVVTATNPGGSTSATSPATAAVTAIPPAVPVNTSPPAITGSVVEGQTLATTNGTWTGSPTSYAYQWQDCNSTGSSCTNIASATTTSYKLASGDVGHTLRAVVTASNTGGSTPATSSATVMVTAIPPAVPVNTSLPVVSGSAIEGQMLNANKGSWSGSPSSYGYKWQDCNSAGEGCVNIGGAIASAYKLGPVDVGHSVRVEVLATNSDGTGTATSSTTATVSKSGGTPTSCFSKPEACGYPGPNNTGPEGHTLQSVGVKLVVRPGGECYPAASIPTGVCSGAGTAENPTVVKNFKMACEPCEIEVISSHVRIEYADIEGVHENAGSSPNGNWQAVRLNTGTTDVQVKHVKCHGRTETTPEAPTFCFRNYGEPNNSFEYDQAFNTANCFFEAGTYENDYCLTNANLFNGTQHVDHYETLYWAGGGSLVMRHNTLLNPHLQTAVIFNKNDSGLGLGEINLEENLLAGGGNMWSGMESLGSPTGPFVFRNNRLARCLGTTLLLTEANKGEYDNESIGGGHTGCVGGRQPEHGYYPSGGSYNYALEVPHSITTWQGNYWDDNLAPAAIP